MPNQGPTSLSSFSVLLTPGQELMSVSPSPCWTLLHSSLPHWFCTSFTRNSPDSHVQPRTAQEMEPFLLPLTFSTESNPLNPLWSGHNLLFSTNLIPLPSSVLSSSGIAHVSRYMLNLPSPCPQKTPCFTFACSLVHSQLYPKRLFFTRSSWALNSHSLLSSMTFVPDVNVFHNIGEQITSCFFFSSK